MASSVLVALLVAAVVPSAATAASCPRTGAVRVPGAEVQRTACLDDLTTTGTEASGHTVRRDWQGLHAAGTRNPSRIPGLQVDGYFPDGSRTNPTGGEAHDSQFVIRLPNRWNGKLVVTGAPGGRGQYANDFIIGDWVLARGYAFASTDKGNTGATFFQDGTAPGDAVAEWHRRVRELTRAAKRSVRRRYARAPSRTYVTGISNGGYLTRYALERDPELYDGGVDWEGVLFRAEGPNLLTYLPSALREYPALRSTGSPAARKAILRAGFERGSEFLWESHHALYWDFTQRAYREELDPDYDGALEAGRPFCPSGTPACDADYDYASRPRAVKEAMARVPTPGGSGDRCSPSTARSTRCCPSVPTRTSTAGWCGEPAGPTSTGTT